MSARKPMDPPPGSPRMLATTPVPPMPADYSNTKELGRLLYTEYLYPFEIAAVILLVAIVAAIVLTLRRRKTTKYQNPAQQVAVKRADRIRIVSMPPVRPPAEAAPEAAGAQPSGEQR